MRYIIEIDLDIIPKQLPPHVKDVLETLVKAVSMMVINGVKIKKVNGYEEQNRLHTFCDR